MDESATATSIPATPPFPRWRSITSWVLLIVSCLGLVLSGVTIWAWNQSFDTEHYVETVAPLTADPDIQQAIATRVSTLIGEQLQRDDVLVGSADGLVRQLAVPLIMDFVDRTVVEYLQSPDFQAFWVAANEKAHQEFVTALTSDAPATLTIQEGQLILDLSPLVTQVNERLTASGIDAVSRIQVDPARSTFVLFQSEAVANIQLALEWLDTLAIVLPMLTLAALAGSLLLARDRWGMAMWAGLGGAIASVLLIVGLRIAREVILDDLPPERSAAAVASLFDIVTRDLRDGARMATLLALLAAGACGIAASTWIRQPPVVTFVARYRSVLAGGIVALACVVLAAADDLSLLAAVGVGITALAGILAVILLSRLPGSGLVPGTVESGPEGLTNQAV